MDVTAVCTPPRDRFLASVLTRPIHHPRVFAQGNQASDDSVILDNVIEADRQAVLQCFNEHFSRCGCEGEPSVEGRTCGTTLGEREVPHHCHLFADFVKEKLPAWVKRRSTELERGLVSRVAFRGDTKVVAAIIAADGVQVTRTKLKCPAKWNAPFKYLNAGTVFGWVPSPSTLSASEQAVATLRVDTGPPPLYP